MQNTIVIWKSIACDPQNSSDLEKRIIIIFPKGSKNDKLIRGISSIEKNMGIEELGIGERLPIKISKDKKGLIIRDKSFNYMFFGSKAVLSHKERIMNSVLKKCSESFKKMEKELHSSSISRRKVKSLYQQVQTIYQSQFIFIFFITLEKFI